MEKLGFERYHYRSYYEYLKKLKNYYFDEVVVLFGDF
jgi:hypothetical protein